MMTRRKTIAAMFAAPLLLAPLPASAHDGQIGRMLGGLFGAVGQALCRGQCPPPGYYPPPAYYPPLGPYNYAPAPAPIPSAPVAPASDPDIAYVQHALNVLAGSNLVEDGVGGPATKAALLGYLGNQMKAAGQS